MRTWLLHVGERLPVDGSARCYRYGYLAQALAREGHDVLRWAPTFSHIEKRHRFAGDRRVEIERNYAIQFVQSPGYRSNVGLGRLVDYQILGRRVRTLMARESAPDLIVAAIPSLEWAAAAIDFGRAHRVPVVIDVRDPWPDGFLHALPPVTRLAGRLALRPYQRMAARVCRGADALVGVSQGYLDWALALAGRPQQARDAVVPLGFEPDIVSPAAMRKNIAALADRGINLDQPTCLFSGSFERSYDLETLIEAARRLSDIGRKNLQFVLCGDGSKRAALERRARRLNLQNVHFLGWADPAMLQAAASVSCIGICAYAANATQGLPNKPFEYMAGRLAIVSSLQGELTAFLRRHQCGITCDAGSINALTNAVNRLVINPPLLTSLRNSGYEAWQQHFRSENLYAPFVDHLLSLAPVVRRAA
jgi:glycosyltransferase involved in cell wall biosynthesis